MPNKPTIGCGSQCGTTGPRESHAAVVEGTNIADPSGGVMLNDTLGMASLSAT